MARTDLARLTYPETVDNPPSWSPDGTRVWVSIGRDWERDSTGQFKNTLGWVDAATGAFREIGTEGKRFRERPAP